MPEGTYYRGLIQILWQSITLSIQRQPICQEVEVLRVTVRMECLSASLPNPYSLALLVGSLSSRVKSTRASVKQLTFSRVCPLLKAREQTLQRRVGRRGASLRGQASLSLHLVRWSWEEWKSKPIFHDRLSSYSNDLNNISNNNS